MKSLIYTLLSIAATIYIGFLAFDIFVQKSTIQIDMGWFTVIYDIIVRYGGLLIILAFAIVNFTGNPLKIAFLVLLIVVIILYIIMSVVPEWFFKLFNLGSKTESDEVITLFNIISRW